MAALRRIIITLAICILFAIIAVVAQDDRDNGDVEEPGVITEEENEQHHEEEEERPMTITFVNEMSNEILELFWEVGTTISSNNCYMIILCMLIYLSCHLTLTYPFYIFTKDPNALHPDSTAKGEDGESEGRSEGRYSQGTIAPRGGSVIVNTFEGHGALYLHLTTSV